MFKRKRDPEYFYIAGYAPCELRERRSAWESRRLKLALCKLCALALCALGAALILAGV